MPQPLIHPTPSEKKEKPALATSTAPLLEPAAMISGRKSTLFFGSMSGLFLYSLVLN